MKTTSVLIGAATLAFAGNEADAFVIPSAGRAISGGASSTSLSALPSSTNRVSKANNSNSLASKGTGRSCCSCTPGKCSCGCPSCSSSSVSSRSHDVGCRCGSCSVRMQAHPVGCGCGECSPTPSAFHGKSCTCACCAPGASARTHAAVCLCGNCRKGSSVTFMGAGGAGEEVSEAGAALRERVAAQPGSVMFEDTMAAVADGFDYTPKRFVNGATSSEAGTNEGSCKVFAFGKIAGLSPEETLVCFGEHYRGVLEDPAGDSHGNIRAFMESGWDGVDFPDDLPLSAKR